MNRLLSFALFSVAAFGTTASAQQKFTLTGRIDGLQTGDTLRFERVIHPNWEREFAFDVVVGQPGTFQYRGKQEHDQHYLMTYLPKEGKAPRCDRSGKEVIVTGGDRIRFSGTADEIYYCALGDGIYDDPLLAETLRLEDSLGMIRGSYAREIEAAYARKDTAGARRYTQLFNNFGRSGSDPGFDRVREARKAYAEAHPDGTLYLLIQNIPSIAYKPIGESKAAYAAYSPELKAGYYGRLYAETLAGMERLADGQPAPDFSVVTTAGETVTKKDYRDGYLLIYHWGLCPGSIYIDGQVRELYDKYKNKGLEVIGLTESVATIRQVYEGLPKDEKTPSAGVEDMRPVLAGMLEHPWTEVEVETDHPDNRSLMDAYKFSGWPFFVLIGPDGKIEARGFTDAFFKARTLLDEKLGAPAE